MRHKLVLTGDKFLEMEYLFVSTAALRVPEIMKGDMSLLLFGFMFHHPEEHPDFCAALPEAIASRMPCVLYYHGWAKLAFEGVRGGRIDVHPYRPRFPPGDKIPMSDETGKPMRLSRTWPVAPSPENTEYHLACCLEHPFGAMQLEIVAAGEVALSVDPAEFVVGDEAIGRPGLGFDETRQSLLNSIQ